MNDYAINFPGPGSLVVAHPAMDDPNFARTVVLLLAHDDTEGSMGLILNRPQQGSGPENSIIAPWLVSSPHPRTVFRGGPVQTDGFVCIVSDPESPAGVQSIDFMSQEPLEGLPHRMFRGYAGWSPGQLADEISAGGWIVVDSAPGDAYSTDPFVLWHDVLARQSGPIAALAKVPVDPGLN